MWKYLFSSPADSQCQTLPGTNQFIYGQLMLDDRQLFYHRRNDSPSQLHFYKITFGSSTMDWANVMTISSTTWSMSPSESWLSSDGSVIYSLAVFGNPRSIYFTLSSKINGAVIGTRYK